MDSRFAMEMQYKLLVTHQVVEMQLEKTAPEMTTSGAPLVFYKIYTRQKIDSRVKAVTVKNYAKKERVTRLGDFQSLPVSYISFGLATYAESIPSQRPNTQI
jgi:hypothetical protein